MVRQGHGCRQVLGREKTEGGTADCKRNGNGDYATACAFVPIITFGTGKDVMREPMTVRLDDSSNQSGHAEGARDDPT